MNQYNLTMEQITAYRTWLSGEEKSAGTIEKYLRDIGAFARWLKGAPVSKDRTSEWKTHLLAQGYAPVTINSMLAALNGLFHFLGWDECRSKFLRIQRRLFREERRELTRGEYDSLLETARSLGRERLALVMETLCATGIRVSEVRYITVEAARAGRAEISLKGKIRTILIPGKLRKKLLQYAKKEKAASGAVFRTRNGKPLSRKQIWAEMKALCSQAGVAASKVFPHNLRHLFARAFYNVCRDVAKLADVLGHSSLETTRLYLISTGKEHERQLERLGFVK